MLLQLTPDTVPPMLTQHFPLLTLPWTAQAGAQKN